MLWCRGGLTSRWSLALGYGSSLPGRRNLLLWCRSGLTSWWALTLLRRSGNGRTSLRPLMLGLGLGLRRCLPIRQRLALGLLGDRHLVLLRCLRSYRPGALLTRSGSGWLIATSGLGNTGATGLA